MKRSQLTPRHVGWRCRLYPNARQTAALAARWPAARDPGKGLPIDARDVRFTARRVLLPRIGPVRWRGGNLPPARIPRHGRLTPGLMRARVWLDAGNRWMLSCDFECRPLVRRMPRVNKVTVRQRAGEIRLSIDKGRAQVVREEAALAKARHRLARLEQSLARRTKGSNGHRRTLALMAVQTRRIRNMQLDIRHQITTAVARGARIIDARGASGQLLHQLKYKAEWHGRRIKVRRGPPEPGYARSPHRARRPKGR